MKQPILAADELAGPLTVGDIIQASGPDVPPEWQGKYFAIMAFDDEGQPVLSVPYHDARLIRPYIAPVIHG